MSDQMKPDIHEDMLPSFGDPTYDPSEVQAQIADTRAKLEAEIRAVIGRYKVESSKGTPAFELAQYLLDCLSDFSGAMRLHRSR